MTFEEGSLCEPLAVALAGLERANIKLGDPVAIWYVPSGSAPHIVLPNLSCFFGPLLLHLGLTSISLLPLRASPLYTPEIGVTFG